jgi:uncharacterized protein YdeI (YjbR/CyaY-like superfamily)
MGAKQDAEIVAFASAQDWQRWLAKNHASSPGVWLRFFKKGSGVASVTHDEALEVALCYGWIDGQLKKHDAESWLHQFAPRRPRSLWSKRNCNLVERLTKSRKMRAAGWKEVEAAKADGRWDRAYDSPGKATVPEDFLALLSRNEKAKQFFETLNRVNTYSIVWRLQTAAKPETRAKRMQAILDMLEAGKKFHE